MRNAYTFGKVNLKHTRTWISVKERFVLLYWSTLNNSKKKINIWSFFFRSNNNPLYFSKKIIYKTILPLEISTNYYKNKKYAEYVPYDQNSCNSISWKSRSNLSFVDSSLWRILLLIKISNFLMLLLASWIHLPVHFLFH